MASTESWKRCARARTKSGSSRCGTRKRRRSWRAAMPNTPASSALCLATSGPGGIHLLNGLYDAKMDGQPVLAITGHAIPRSHRHAFAAGRRSGQALHGRVRLQRRASWGRTTSQNVVDLACRTALSRRGVAHITIPVDIQDHGRRQKSTAPSANVRDHTGDGFAPASAIASRTKICNAPPTYSTQGKKVAILAGRGALWEQRRTRCSWPKSSARPSSRRCWAKAWCRMTVPYTTGGIGLLGTEPSQEAMEECDTLFMIGTSFPYIEFLPEAGPGAGVQIDIDPMRIGLRYPVDVGLGRRQPRTSWQNCCRCSTQNEDRRFPRRQRRKA